jgi:TPP-dependent pyruvate/acetoin dehydrogenase alpha subunit
MEFVTPFRDLARRAVAYDMPSDTADGMDFFDVYEKAGVAIERARAGEGPTLLECKTYRYMGHFVGDNLAYRSKEESEDWKQNRDPLDNFESSACEMSLVESDDLRRIDGEVLAELDAAVEAAIEAPFPTPDDVLRNVYVGE